MQNILIATSTIADGNMSGRFDGADVVAKNRERFLATHNLEPKNAVWMQCDHSTTITPVNWGYGGASVPSEVLVIQEKGMVLGLLTADCLPVTLYDHTTNTLALAHMSRVTIAAGLLQKTVSFLQQTYGIDPANLHIHVGPHIAPESYIFPNTGELFSDAIEPFVTRTDETVMIDLDTALNHQLLEAGVAESNITTDRTNTVTSSAHFSHYAANTLQQPNKAGRIATIAVLQ